MKTTNILLGVLCIGVFAVAGMLAFPRLAHLFQYVSPPEKTYYETEAKCTAYALALAGAYETNGEEEAALRIGGIYTFMLHAYPMLNKDAVKEEALRIGKTESQNEILSNEQECKNTYERAAKLSTQ